MVLGDSLSAAWGLDQDEGWVSLLQRRLDAQGHPHRVANVSVSGETTSGALSRIDRALSQHRPDLVIIEVGGNDGLRGLPLATIERNLAEIITSIQARGADVLLAGMQLPPNYGPAYTRGFQRVFTDLADRYDTGLIPFLLAGLEHDRRHFLEDGIHPNSAAQGLILDNVWPHLETMLDRPATVTTGAHR